MKRVSFILIIGIISFILMSAYGGFKFYQKSALETKAQQLENQVADGQTTFLEFQNRKLNQAISAKQVLNNVKDTGVKWSRVIKAIRSTIPTEDEKPLAEVVAYSAASNSGISLNMRTNIENENPYLEVARIIKSFDESKHFSESFVPSISAGSDDEGREFVNFVMNLKYVDSEEDSADDLGDVLSEIVEDAESEAKPVLR